MKLMNRHYLPGLALTIALIWIVTTSAGAQQRAVPRGSQGGGQSSGPSSGSPSGGSSAPQGARPPSSPRGDSRSSSPSTSGTSTARPSSDPGARPRDGQFVTGAAVNRPPLDWTNVGYPGVGYPGGGYYPYYPGGYYPAGYYPVGYYPWGYGGFGFGVYYGYGGFYGSVGFYNPWFYGSYGFPIHTHSYTVGPDGSLHLKVKPNHALVYVDGYFAGAVDDFDGAFQRLHVEPGAHHLEIRADGYEPLTLDVRVLADRTVTYEGDLKKQF